MFHGRSRFNYEKDSATAVQHISEIILRAFYAFSPILLMKLFFRFCMFCEGFDSPWNIVKNLKTIFTNVYCTVSNRLKYPDLPAKEFEILALGFRAFYFKIKYPTLEVVKFQVRMYFKMTGFQLLSQVLPFHTSSQDSRLISLFEKVAYLRFSFLNYLPFV